MSALHCLWRGCEQPAAGHSNYCSEHRNAVRTSPFPKIGDLSSAAADVPHEPLFKEPAPTPAPKDEI